MGRIVHFGTEVAVLLCLSLAAPAMFAQHGRTAPPPAAARRAPVAATRPPANRAATVRHVNFSVANVAPFSGSFPSMGGLAFSGGPLGTQTANILARNEAIKGAIDPATQWRLELAQRFLHDNQGIISPEFFLTDGGYPYVIPESADANGEQPGGASQAAQPQSIVVQQPVAAAQALPKAAQENSDVSSLRDEGMFTIVLRNGTQIPAAAFTRLNGKIIYITPDGSRRTVSKEEIDVDATLRVNQERGIPVSL